MPLATTRIHTMAPAAPAELGLPLLPNCPAPHHCSALSLHVNTALIAASFTPRAPPPSLSNKALSTSHFGYLRYPGNAHAQCATRAAEFRVRMSKGRANKGANAKLEGEPKRRLRNWARAIGWNEWGRCVFFHKGFDWLSCSRLGGRKAPAGAVRLSLLLALDLGLTLS